jgi:hypothetical protein
MDSSKDAFRERSRDADPHRDDGVTYRSLAILGLVLMVVQAGPPSLHSG